MDSKSEQQISETPCLMRPDQSLAYMVLNA